MMAAENRDKALFFIITAVTISTLLWGIGWLFNASYYTIPNAEDLSSANVVNRLGLFQSLIVALVVDYTRYTSNFLYGFNVLTIGSAECFGIMPMLCITFFIASFYFFITSLVNSTGRRGSLILASLSFVLIHYSVEPHIYYGLFYMASTFDFIYPWFFAFMWVGCLIRSIRQPVSKTKTIYFFLGIFFLILSYGCTELFISINGFILLPFILYTLFYDRSLAKLIIPYCLIGFSCIAFLILCPSPKITTDNIFTDFESRYEGTNFVFASIKSYWVFYSKYLFNTVSVLLVITNTLLFKRLAISEHLYFKPNAKTLLTLFLYCTLGAYISSWVYFVPKGLSGDFPLGLYNCIGLLSQLGLYLILPLYLGKLLPTDEKTKAYLTIEAITGISSLVFLIWGTNNISLIKKEFDAGYIEDVKYKADKFYSEVSEIKKRGKPPYIVYFENPDIIPSTTFYATDIKPNREAGFWNIAYEDYFEVDEVRLKGDTIFK